MPGIPGTRCTGMIFFCMLLPSGNTQRDVITRRLVSFPITKSKPRKTKKPIHIGYAQSYLPAFYLPGIRRAVLHLFPYYSLPASREKMLLTFRSRA